MFGGDQTKTDIGHFVDPDKQSRINNTVDQVIHPPQPPTNLGQGYRHTSKHTHTLNITQGSSFSRKADSNVNIKDLAPSNLYNYRYTASKLN